MRRRLPDLFVDNGLAKTEQSTCLSDRNGEPLSTPVDNNPERVWAGDNPKEALTSSGRGEVLAPNTHTGI